MSGVRFDPDGAAIGGGVFGLPCGPDEAALVLLPVPWEATTSYGGGASRGPSAILAASRQVDLFDHDVLRPWEPGIHMLAPNGEVARWNDEAKPLAARVLEVGGDLGDDAALRDALERVEALGREVNAHVHAETGRLLDAGKLVGVIGGDHSVPLGAYEALGARHGAFGILHFDAHSDTRAAYEGFRFSHASIMRNTLDDVPQVERLVQVGIRDYCEEEVRYCESLGERVRVFWDGELARRSFEGEPFAEVAREIVGVLPSDVWISLDIDALDPSLCPHTGTPVPGGLSFAQVCHVIGQVARSGRRVLGFDLVEVAPGPEGDEWDANVGARLTYKLAAFTLASHGLAALRR